MIERLVGIPLSVLQSPAYATLPPRYRDVLMCLLASSDVNGRLSLTRAQAAKLGLRNERRRIDGLKELERRGLIKLVKRGGMAARQPNLYAVTWLPDECASNAIASASNVLASASDVIARESSADADPMAKLREVMLGK